MAKSKLALKVWAAVVLVALVLISACAKPAPPPPEWGTIKWGMATELSGVTAEWGISEARTGQLAVKHINDAGGIVVGDKRYKVELIIEDCKSTPEGTVAAYEKLITIEKVDAMFGPVSTTLGIAGVPIIDKYNMVCISPASFGIQLANASRWEFMGCFQQDTVSGAFAYVAQILEPKPKTLACIVANMTGTVATMRLAEEKAKAAGLEVVAFESVPATETDFMSVATSIKAADPDIIFHNQQAMQSGLFLKQLGELGILATEVPMVGLAGFSSIECEEIAGHYYEGVYAMGEMVPRAEVPITMTFKDDYHKMFGYAPGAHEMAQYDCFWSLAYAFEKVTKIGQDAEAQEQLRQALLSVEFDGLMGPFSYAPNGASRMPIAIKHVENGKKVFVDWYIP